MKTIILRLIRDPESDTALGFLAGVLIALIVVLGALIAGCRAPTEPPMLTEAHRLSVGTAAVGVISTCEVELDMGRVQSELDTALRRIESEGYSADCIDGMVVTFYPDVATGHAGSVPYGEVAIGCGQYGATEHEPGHFCAYQTGHTCWKRVWHNGLKLGSCQ